jgi:hypothetical protein
MSPVTHCYIPAQERNVSVTRRAHHGFHAASSSHIDFGGVFSFLLSTILMVVSTGTSVPVFFRLPTQVNFRPVLTVIQIFTMPGGKHHASTYNTLTTL